MAKWQFTKGLHDVGNGLYAYLQPNGSWGWSNAGLIVSQEQTLLVDTLLGLDITRDMLDEMKRKVPQSGKIDLLVNTHANIDHFLGNELVLGAEIISSKIAAEDIIATDLDRIVSTFENPPTNDSAEFIHETMARKFKLSGVTLTPPTRTFEGTMELSVGDKTVKLIDLGPAHTRSDTIVYVPADKTIFTGDLLFNNGTPILWAGPVGNWIAACDYILGLDVEIIVPGHGAITDKSAVRLQKAYFEYIYEEARKRFDAGLSWEEAARDMSLGEFAKMMDAERIVPNVCTLYREFGDLPHVPERELFGAMGRWRRMAAAAHAGHNHANCSHP